MKNLTSSLFPYDPKTVSRGALACVKIIEGKRSAAKEAAIQGIMNKVRRKWWGGKYQISRDEAEKEIAAQEFYDDLCSYDWTIYGERDLDAARGLISSLVSMKDGETVYLTRDDARLVNFYIRWEKAIEEDDNK